MPFIGPTTFPKFWGKAESNDLGDQSYYCVMESSTVNDVMVMWCWKKQPLCGNQMPNILNHFFALAGLNTKLCLSENTETNGSEWCVHIGPVLFMDLIITNQITMETFKMSSILFIWKIPSASQRDIFNE